MHDWVQNDYQATLHVSKTRYNVSDFVRNNKKELWKIFVPLMPFIVGLYLLYAEAGPAVSEGYAVLFSLIFFSLMAYIYYRFCLYFPAKAVNAKITLRKAFSLSSGHLWRLLFVMVRTMFMWVLALIVYILLASAVSAFVLGLLQTSTWVYVISFVLYLPILLYFLPILTILGVTALSNYYLYAVQNDNEAVKG